MNSHHLCWTLCVASLCTAFLGCNRTEPAPAERAPVIVTVSEPVVKQIVEWDAYTGRLEAVHFVEVRSRVSGYLESVHFTEGQLVEQGDLLFVIDPRPFEAALAAANASMSQAKSQLQQAEAGLAEAKAEQLQSDALVRLAETRLERVRSLMQSSATSQDELEQREAEYLQAKADTAASLAKISSAEAAIQTATAAIEASEAGIAAAKLDLDYSRIAAPVAGRISSRYVTEGNLISGGTGTPTLLTTITSVDPIYCVFDASEQEVLKYVRLAQSGSRESSRVAKNPVFLGLVDETGFPHAGFMDFVDNRLDANTASLRARAVFPNKNKLLLPGLFARVRIPGSAPYEAVLIPDSAIGTDQSSQYVYVVTDGVVKRQSVKTGPIVDGLRVIREGLQPNQTLVIEGLLQARPDMEVQTKPGTIEMIDDGLPDSYVAGEAIQ